jgi:hypothetical protein
MKPPQSINDLQQVVDQAWKSWRNLPDGPGYQALTRQVGLFVHAVVQDAIKGGRALLSSPIPHVGRVSITVIESGGRRTIMNHCHVTDFDEVVNDYLAWLCERYLLKPGTRHIQSPAYIRMGIVMRAYTLERRLRNTRQRESATQEPDAFSMAEKFPGDLYYLKTLWFHPYGSDDASATLPGSFQGLSLRYLYTAMRYNAGVSLSETATELGIHPSRLTAVKKEYSRLFSDPPSDAWLAFPMDYIPVGVTDPMLSKLNLKGVHQRYSLIKTTADNRIRQKILRSKHILWHLLQFSACPASRSRMKMNTPIHLEIPVNAGIPDTRMTVMQKNPGHIILMDFQPLAQIRTPVRA